jgi:hypothetical protein
MSHRALSDHDHAALVRRRTRNNRLLLVGLLAVVGLLFALSIMHLRAESRLASKGFETITEP